MTVEEYACYYGTQFQAIAECLGLEYKQEMAAGWIVFTVSKMTE